MSQMKIGSSNPQIIYLPVNSKGKVDINVALTYHAAHPEIEGTPDGKRLFVCSCYNCHKQFWGPINARQCQTCREDKKFQSDKRAAYMEVRKDKYRKSHYNPLRGIANEMQLSDERQELYNEQILAEELQHMNAAVCDWNEHHCCSCYHGGADSLTCYYCRKGIDYVTGTKDLSARCCPEHPVAGNGQRYIYRTAYRKDANSTVGITGGERIVLDNSTEQS